MANPRLIKKRVRSINNIVKITKALEMVSASKVQKAQEKAINTKPFANTIYELIGLLSDEPSIKEIPLMRIPDKVKSDLYLLVSTNRGLAGSLNTNLFRYIESFLSQKEKVKHFFINIGEKGRLLAFSRGEVIADFSEEKNLKNVTSDLVKIVTDGFSRELYDEVYLVYSEFINVLVQKPKIKKILPISKLSLEEELGKETFELMGESSESKDLRRKEILPHKVSYTFEPNPITVLANLLPYYLEIQIAEALYEAEASEHSARMIAMKNANQNASEITVSLTLLYNKARQSFITAEISDINTAKESISKQDV